MIQEGLLMREMKENTFTGSCKRLRVVIYALLLTAAVTALGGVKSFAAASVSLSAKSITIR